MSLARELQNKLHELQRMTQNAIVNTERSGIRKPAPTVEGKVEQATQWLMHPNLDDKGLGMCSCVVLCCTVCHVIWETKLKNPLCILFYEIKELVYEEYYKLKHKSGT